MIFRDETNKHHKDGSSIFQDDTLLSLLRRPLPSMEHSTQPMGSTAKFFPPLSFEDPFEDPSMEPMPLRSPAGVGSSINITGHSPLVPSMPEAIFGRDDCLASPSDDGLHTNILIDMLKIDIDCAGSKRTSKDIFELGPSYAKRQRISRDKAIVTQESTARFKPYQEQQWQAQFDKLIEFKRMNGHCCVPHSYQEDRVLARWVKRQRYQYKKFNDGDQSSTMTTRRIEELESIGFVWHSHHAAWQEKLNELKVFKQRTGHCNVPSHYPENAALSTWVKCQRRQYKLYVSGSSSHMTAGRIQALESMGFVFDVRQRRSVPVLTAEPSSWSCGERSMCQEGMATNKNLMHTNTLFDILQQ